MKKHPKIVARFEKIDEDNPLHPIKLRCAITHPSDYCVERHGVLGAVIRYHIPHQYVDGK